MGKLLSKGNQEENDNEAGQELEVPHDQTPTVFPQSEDEFSAVDDAKSLNEAFQSFGANETTITGIIANRSWEQRQEISDAYRDTFKKSLISEVDSELSGHYRNALDWLLLDPDSVRVSYISKIVNENLLARLPDTRGKDVAILETVFPLTKTELHGLRKTYEKVHGNQLSKNIDAKVTGPFKDWVVELTQTGRNEANPAPKAIAKDVTFLKNLAPELWSPEVKELQQLFCKQGLFHIYSVLNSYELEMGQRMMNVIEKVKEEFRVAFTVMVTSCLNGYEFFADGLYQSMKGLGTNDDKLIYLMIDRCETDLGNVRVEFEIKYKKSLESFIKEDTSGDYKNLMLAILDNPQIAATE